MSHAFSHELVLMAYRGVVRSVETAIRVHQALLSAEILSKEMPLQIGVYMHTIPSFKWHGMAGICLLPHQFTYGEAGVEE